MIWSDDAFPYAKHKGINFEIIAIEEYDEGNDTITHQIEYCKDLGMYRVTHFLNGYWNGDVVFDEVDKNEI